MRAYYLAERGQWNRSMEVLQRAVIMDQKNGLLAEQFAKCVSIAALHFRFSEHAKAKQTLAPLLGRSMDLVLHTAAIALFARNGAIAEASRWMAALPVGPAVPRLLVLRAIAQGEIAVAEGDFGRGEALMRGASQLLPTFWPREFLAHALLRSNKTGEAASVLEQCAELKPALFFSRTLPLPGFWGDLLVSLGNNSAIQPNRAAHWRTELAKLRPT